MPSAISRNLLLVTPIIGIIPARFRPSRNPTEVESVFTVPLRIFLEKNPDIYSFEDIDWPNEGQRFRLHIFIWKGYEMYGYTNCVLFLIIPDGA